MVLPVCEREGDSEREGGWDAERECTFYIYYLENPSFKLMEDQEIYISSTGALLHIDHG